MNVVKMQVEFSASIGNSMLRIGFRSKKYRGHTSFSCEVYGFHEMLLKLKIAKISTIAWQSFIRWALLISSQANVRFSNTEAKFVTSDVQRLCLQISCGRRQNCIWTRTEHRWVVISYEPGFGKCEVSLRGTAAKMNLWLLVLLLL